MATQRVIVIGSGFGGLAAAVRLAARGHQVTLLEQRDQPGGRAYVYRQDGFTFDGGPTIITAPWLIDELFAVAGRRTADYVRLVPVDPFYNVRFDDGSVFRYDGNREHVLAEIRKFNPDDVEGYLRFVAGGDAIFKTGFGLIDKPFHRLADMARVLPDLVRLRSDRSVAAYVNRFITDERLRQVFSFHPLLVGGNPFQTTSIYTLIHTLEQRWGVWFAMGGTGALVSALARLFEELGGELRLSTEGDQIEGDDRRYEDVAHHEILMGPRYRGLLDDIFTRKRLADDFSLYLHRPTATDPSLAPPGCDSWYVLSPVPHLGGATNPG